MKKVIIKGIIFIVVGIIAGNAIFEHKLSFVKNILNKESYYFIQEGVYNDKKSLQNNLINITNKIVEYDRKSDKYYVYLGITKDKEVLDKLTKIYNKRNISIFEKEKYIDSEEFSNNVRQFDNLIKQTNSDEEILTIEEVVLANYEEISKKE